MVRLYVVVHDVGKSSERFDSFVLYPFGSIDDLIGNLTAYALPLVMFGERVRDGHSGPVYYSSKKEAMSASNTRSSIALTTKCGNHVES